MSARLPDPSTPLTGSTGLPVDVFVRALEARDTRFDGVFFVGIVSTGIYCRPICPARVSRPEHRRFFRGAAEAERNGFRPCRRCRPELAPGRSLADAVPRLAGEASRRIAGGALNGRGVGDLARDLCVSERQLRRALRAELGISPTDLARTHRLLLAKQLLTETTLPLTRVAFASGFQSVRSFQATFRKHYRMAPRELRRAARTAGSGTNGDRRRSSTGNGLRPRTDPAATDGHDTLTLALAYRPPLDWPILLAVLRADALPDVEIVDARQYTRLLAVDGHVGRLTVEKGKGDHLRATISTSLLPVLMPLIQRVRRAFDLDASPAEIDAHLRDGGLGALVERRPGLRLPGAWGGFEAVFRSVVKSLEPRHGTGHDAHRVAEHRVDSLGARLIDVLGEPVVTGIQGLTRLIPEAGRVAGAGADALTELGLPPRAAAILAALARRCADGTLPLHPGVDGDTAREALLAVDGVDARRATRIVSRATGWPDPFLADEPALLRASGAPDPRDLLERAAAWRPWRGYAALHLHLAETDHRASEPDLSVDD